MAEVERPWRKPWKLLAFLLVTACLAAGGLAVRVHSLRDRKWAAMEERVDKLFEELDAPPLGRLPLGRELFPGNAWDDYTAAAAAPDDRKVRQFGSVSLWLRRDTNADAADAAFWLSEFAPRIEMIRKGARRESAKPPLATRTASGLQYPVFQWYSYESLAGLCVGKARLLTEAGDLSGALDLLVDVCLFGRDLAESRMPLGASSGPRVMEIAFLEIREILQHESVSGEDLNRLDRALGLLDDHFPDRSSSVRLGLFQFGDLLEREDRADANLTGHTDRSRRSWKYGFSARLEAATAFFAAESFAERALALESQPWSVASAGYRALDDERSKVRLLYNSGGGSGYQSRMLTKGQLRLLRVAAHYLLGGQVLPLEDPAGGRIRTRQCGTSLLIWKRPLYSTPEWEPKKAEQGYSFGLTIEVPIRLP